MYDDISQYDLGHTVSERIEAINDLLDDISELDIVESTAADEYIDDAEDALVAAAVDVSRGEEREEAGDVEFEDTPDLPAPGTLPWAIGVMEKNKGQSYAKAEFIHHVAGTVLEYARQKDLLEADYDEGDLQAGVPIEEVVYPASEARGMVSVPYYEPIAGWDDVSSMLVEALGGEPSDFTAGGRGFTADGIHDENVETLKDLLDYEEPDDDEAK